jgi:hypothetical protein
MKKSFALCEAFGLTPCPLSAAKVPSTQPSVAERGEGEGRPPPFGRLPVARP